MTGSTFERCAIAAEERPTVSPHDRRRSAPAGGKDKITDRLTLTRLQFAFLQIIRKDCWIARISHGNHRHRLEARRNLAFPAGLFHIVPGHLMRLQPQAGRLENKVLDGHAGVMQGMPVWCSIVLKKQTCNRKAQDRRTERPLQIPFREAPEQPVVVGSVVLGGREKPPRLFIVRRGRPTRRLEQTLEFIRFQRPFLEGAWTPAACNEVCNVMLRRRRLFHPVSCPSSPASPLSPETIPRRAPCTVGRPRPDATVESRSWPIRPRRDCAAPRAHRDSSPDRLCSEARRAEAPTAVH